MSEARKRPCTICRRWFRPDARVGVRQRACTNPECQTARRRKTQASPLLGGPHQALPRVAKPTLESRRCEVTYGSIVDIIGASCKLRNGPGPGRESPGTGSWRSGHLQVPAPPARRRGPRSAAGAHDRFTRRSAAGLGSRRRNTGWQVSATTCGNSRGKACWNAIRAVTLTCAPQKLGPVPGSRFVTSCNVRS